MKLGKKTALLGMVLLLSLFIVSTATTQAKSDRIEIIFEYTWDSTDAPKKEWISDKGILHTLQTPHYGSVTSGDIEGSLYYSGNLILDLATFSGKGGGIIEFTGLYNGETAGFRGIMLFTIEFGELTGTLNCPGTGAFASKLLKGTVYTILGTEFTYVTMVIWN